MNTATSDRATAIFLALSGVAPDERRRHLDERCGDDGALRQEVERLLAQLDLPDDSLPGAFLTAADLRRSVRDGEVVQPAGTAIGDFIVIRQIGSGGTGVVYLAHQQHPSRVVALKVLRHEFVASAVQRRFAIEAELLAQLHHPGIAQIYAAHPGDAATPPYIAMELVNGPPLTDFAESRNLSIAERVELVARACDAVQHAHQRGIIHRDLKPGNILVNEDGQPKVLDFGVARTVGMQVSMTTIETQAGQLVGTVAYMSPEQIAASPSAIDTRTDIHALGVILFRVLAGRLPFGHDDPPLPELARRIVNEDATRLGSIDPALRGDLEIITARALAKEKERRYPSAESMANDLRRYLAGQPISAAADSAWYLVRRQVGRYRLALGLSAAVLVAVSALAIYAIMQRSQATAVNARLEDELTTSTIERGRLLSLTGNLPGAEDLLWRELFKHPDSRHAHWTLWDVYSREPSLWRGVMHAEGTMAVRFSPDGRYVVSTGRADGLLRLIDAGTGAIVRTFTNAPPSGSRRALFAGDHRIVSGADDGTIRVWDVATGAVVKEIPKAAPVLNDLWIDAAATIAVTTAQGKVKVWSLDSGRLVADVGTVVDRIWTAVPSPDGRLVLTGGDDGSMAAFDVKRQALAWKVQAGRSQIASLAFSPDGRTLASGGAEGLINLWTPDGERLRTIATDNGRVRNLAFDRSGVHLAAAGQWKTKLWDLDRPSLPPRDFGGAEGTTDVDIRGDASALVTCHGGAGMVRLWDLAADSRTSHWAGHQQTVGAILIDKDGASIVTAGADGRIVRWTPGVADGATWAQSERRVSALASSDNGRWVVSSGYPKTAAVWDAASGRRLADLGVDGPSRAAAFSEDDRRIYVGEQDGTLRIWDWDGTTATNPRAMRVEGVAPEILALATRGNRLYVAHRQQLLIERDVESNRELRRWFVPAAPFAVALSADRARVAVGTWVGGIEVWDTRTGALLQQFKGQTALINGLDFSPDGTMIVSASRDGTTRLGDVITGRWLATIASRGSGAEHVRFFPDGRRIAIGYQDGEVEIRDLGYFFRYVAGHTEYQLGLFRQGGESFPRAADVLEWSRRQLARRE